ncbi:MAG: hypothetical protein ACLSWY_15145 [Ruthenibacterium lactatiformans]
MARNTQLDLFGRLSRGRGVPEEHLDVPTVLLDAFGCAAVACTTGRCPLCA